VVRKSGYVHAAKKKCDSWHVVDDVRGVRDVRLRRDGISMHEAGVGMRENPILVPRIRLCCWKLSEGKTVV